MLEGIEPERLMEMTPQEERWLENIKKGFHDSDLAVKDGKAADKCMEELFKALDAAKNLRRSLQGADAKKSNQRDQYIEFIELEVPSPVTEVEDEVVESGDEFEKGNGGSPFSVKLIDARTGKERDYSFAEMVYDARCMVVHENENLNAAEQPEYHIQFDWTSGPHSHFIGHQVDGRFVANGFVFWNRLRQILAKFITGIDGLISFQRDGSFSITCEPKMESVKPSSRQ